MEREFEVNQEKRWYKLGAMVGIYIAYLGVGAAIFQYFESPYEVRISSLSMILSRPAHFFITESVVFSSDADIVIDKKSKNDQMNE